MKQLVEYFENIGIQNILDVGTGTGDFLGVLEKTFPSANIMGIDPNEESIREAQNLYKSVSFKKMNAERLNFEESSFDLVCISMALHHLKDIKKALAEMLRVLKPDGYIVVSELFSDNLNTAQEMHKMFHHFRSRTDRLLGINHNETFKKNEILEMIKEAGVSIQHHFEFNKGVNLIDNTDELELRVEKMKGMLESVKGFNEYTELMPIVVEFQEKVFKYGFQPASRVVVIGKHK